jgi:hypothetical protein
MRTNRIMLKWVLWFSAIATILVIYIWHEHQEVAMRATKLEKQKVMLQSLMMAHSPPWTNVEFELIPQKNVIIARGTVENQAEWDDLHQELTNSVAAVGIGVSVYVDVMDTNAAK